MKIIVLNLFRVDFPIHKGSMRFNEVKKGEKILEDLNVIKSKHFLL